MGVFWHISISYLFDFPECLSVYSPVFVRSCVCFANIYLYVCRNVCASHARLRSTRVFSVERIN